MVFGAQMDGEILGALAMGFGAVLVAVTTSYRNLIGEQRRRIDQLEAELQRLLLLLVQHGINPNPRRRASDYRARDEPLPPDPGPQS